MVTYLILGVAGAFSALAVSRGLVAGPPTYGFLARRLAVMTVGFMVLWFVVVKIVV